MSLDKAIEHGKEHRKPYYRGGRHDRTCRPGGSCSWCQSNRMIQQQKQVDKVKVEDRDGN